ncbi:uncharacterized protein [Euwallacea similis]|uniref:uncharacterized protein n=1 Tax=Euwallacea similis TaxID=1736056 RepID=UPI00344F4FAC
MKYLILASALVAISAAFPADESSTKTKRGLIGLEHAPTILSAAPLLKSYETPIIHTAPVITKVFDAPAPLPLLKSYEPLITGPLIAKGIGPHIIGTKTILPAPIIKTAPLISAPIYSKSIWAPSPIISLAPKWSAPILDHGW